MTDPAPPTGSLPHVECRGVTKRFGATVALDAVDIEVLRGHVHALVGENGAGKSTLGKLIAGVHRPDDGLVRIDGQLVAFGSPADALAVGVTIIAQELSLVPERSVLENVYLGIEDRVGPWVRTSRLRKRYADLVARTGIDVDPDAPVGRLPIAQQQKVEILRSLARESDVIVMDEPTARLAGEEVEALLQTIRSLAAAGTTVVYVSHFLDEVLDLADTITIMRDGRVISTGAAVDHTHRSLIEGMTGRAAEQAFPDPVAPGADAPPVLEASGLTRRGAFADVSLTVRAGEIVALAGLVGSGRTEVVRAVAGVDPLDAGDMVLDGTPYHPASPAAAIDRGVAMIPESRKDLGLVLSRSVRENTTLPHLRGLRRLGFIRRHLEAEMAEQRVRRVGVRTPGIDVAVSALSGGNQQKVLFARALVRPPRLLIADEPTRGVDVGAKRSIYDTLTDLAAEGMAVLMVSSELEEVLGIAHRILVMREGRLVAELDGASATEHAVMAAAFAADPEVVFSGIDPEDAR